jgi:hypothetical protein
MNPASSTFETHNDTRVFVSVQREEIAHSEWLVSIAAAAGLPNLDTAAINPISAPIDQACIDETASNLASMAIVSADDSAGRGSRPSSLHRHFAK